MNVKGANILVTGGAGFIGSRLCKSLIGAGAKVFIIDNFSTGLRSNLTSEIEVFEGNIADREFVTKVIETKKPEFLFHLAFNTSVPDSVKDPLIEMDSIAGSIILFELAQKHGVKKTVFASSEFIYGNTKVFPTSETEPLDPIAPYSISKTTGENYLLFYHRQFNLPSVILRFGTVYGPGQKKGALTDYIRRLSQDRQAEIWGDGTKTREYVFIDDIVRALVMSLDVPNDMDFPVFNVGTGVETSLNELYGKIAAQLSKKPAPIYLPDRPGEQMRCLLNSDKIRQTLDWNPRFTLDEGLRIRIEDYLRNPC